MSFADPAFLVNGTDQPKFPFTEIPALREKLDSKAKVGVAIGGWEKTPGFTNVTDSTLRAAFVSNTKKMVDKHGLDFIDIDWEYPGGDGIDYKISKDQAAKDLEVQVFPQMLEELKAALGADKELSVAVAGRVDDIAVYENNKTNTRRIWDAVDFVNVMTYDLMNRRDNATLHSSSAKGASLAVDKYMALNLTASKINLGFPLYAKYVELARGDSCAGPLGCPVVAAENEDGTDAHTSDYVTFEAYNLVDANVTTVGTSSTCGPNSPGTRCPPSLCCSRYGNCGETGDFCDHMCLRNFGECNENFEPDMVKSFQKAISNGEKDDDEGAMWYIDDVEGRRFFWTWDSTEIIERKIKDIVNAKGLGGVMAWSLGEDSEGARVKAINAALST